MDKMKWYSVDRFLSLFDVQVLTRDQEGRISLGRLCLNKRRAGVEWQSSNEVWHPSHWTHFPKVKGDRRK